MPRYYDDTTKKRVSSHNFLFVSENAENSASLLWVWPTVSAASACDLRAVLVSLRWDFPRS